MNYEHDNKKLKHMILRDIGLTESEAGIYMQRTEERLSISEIAEERNCSSRNVSNHLHSARKKLDDRAQSRCTSCASFKLCNDASFSRNHQAHICVNYRPEVLE